MKYKILIISNPKESKLNEKKIFFSVRKMFTKLMSTYKIGNGRADEDTDTRLDRTMSSWSFKNIMSQGRCDFEYCSYRYK